MGTTRISTGLQIQERDPAKPTSGWLEVAGEFHSYRGARDGRFGPAIEPDEYGFEINSVTNEDGVDVTSLLSDAELQACEQAMADEDY